MCLSSARVIKLPTAAAQPVQQTPRRGRFPRCVTTLCEAKFRAYQQRKKRDEFRNLIDILEYAATLSQESASKLRREAAEVREKMRTFGGAV